MSKADPETLALRAPPRPVTRLNRRMLIATVATMVCLVLGVTVWSLQRNLRLVDARPELHNVDRIARVEGLDRLPPDYSKLAPTKPAAPAAPPAPILGKPLPGDLGEAMLRAERASTSTDPTADALRAERANREREAEDAAKAPLFFRSSSNKQHVSAPSEAPATASDAGSGSQSDLKGAVTSEGELTQRTALASGSDRTVVSQHSVGSPVSPYQVMAGTVISAALLTGINSDLPGIILATVTEPVYDTRLGKYLLIPQGTRLIGEYNSQIAFGQRRVLLVWNRLIFPDASSLTLDRLPGTDAAGNSGLEDGIDRHWRQLIAGAALSTLIGVAAELAAPDRTSGQGQVIVSAQQSVQDSINQVGQELTRRNLNVQPTLTIRPGFPVRVIVSKDLVLRPYQPLFIQRSAP